MSFLLWAALLAAPPAASGELLDVQRLIPDLVLDIRYATVDNVLGRPLYPVARCLLRPQVATRLATAADLLRQKGLRLRVFDCYRPLSIQRALWKAHPHRGWVADPDHGGSNHNRGAAVDVSLATSSGGEVPMPTPYDAFSDRRARAAAEDGVPAEARANRRTLQQAMEAAGFKTIRSEWWHFDGPRLPSDHCLDVPLQSVP